LRKFPSFVFDNEQATCNGVSKFFYVKRVPSDELFQFFFGPAKAVIHDDSGWDTEIVERGEDRGNLDHH
jgi:hypothetical protein